MASVYRRENETFEKMYKRFKKLVEKERVISIYRRKQYYMKPSEVRRYKKLKSQMLRRKQELKRLKALERLKKGK